MASVYTQLKKGSSGNEVNALQTELSKKGYALQNTGLYDDATEAAVRKYQQDNNLTVDGIAGDITLGSLYGTNNNTATGGYKPSGQLTEAQKYAQAVQMQKPGEYQSAYTPQLQAQFDAIMNRQPFQYDIGSDALFQQMSDMYSQQARRGMQDTMGQATALTGGYGNSYAQGVGQAAYGQQMQQLAALAPEYMNNAYSRWQNEGVDMMNRYNVLAQMEDSDYGRYVDSLNRYWQEADRAQQAADNLYNREYGEYMDNLNWEQARDEMLFQREKHQAQLDSENREYAYNTALMMLQSGKMPSADLLAAAGLSAEDAATIQSMYKKKSSGSGGSSSNKSKIDLSMITAGVANGLSAFNAVTNAMSSGLFGKEKSGEEALNAGEKAGVVSFTNTDKGDGVMSYQDWIENSGLKIEGGIGGMPGVKNGQDQLDAAYEEYVADALADEVLKGHMTEEEATQAFNKNTRKK